MITIARIDERLVHGQVAYSWTVAYKSQGILVIDNDVAKDSFQVNLIKMACPSGVKGFVMNEEDAYAFLIKNESKRIFVVTKTPDIYLNLVKKGVAIESINVGGLYFKEDRKQISKTIYLDDALTATFKELSGLGVKLDTRTSPPDNYVDLITMI